MAAIEPSWGAAHEREDGKKRELIITVGHYCGGPLINVDNRIGGGPGIAVWSETQLGELIAGLIAAARQIGFDIDQVEDFAGSNPAPAD